MFTDLMFLFSILAGAVIAVQASAIGRNDYVVAVIQFDGEAQPVAGCNSLAASKEEAMAVAEWLRGYQKMFYEC